MPITRLIPHYFTLLISQYIVEMISYQLHIARIEFNGRKRKKIAINQRLIAKHIHTDTNS